MQQQMFDQFQQAMVMMFQMFNTLQRDQVGLISEELQHLRELSEEVHALQVELAERSQPAPVAASAVPAAPVRPVPLTDTAPVPPSPSPGPTFEAAPVPPSPAPELPVEAPPKRYRYSQPVREPAPAAASARPPESPSATGTSPAAGRKTVSIPQGKTDEEVQAWLNERITAIQQERQTRWQKIVNFMTGQGGPSP
jgi:hypothetical protein